MVKTSKPLVSERKKLPSNITACDRVRKYQPGIFHAEDGLLFCSSCNVVLDHLRKATIDRHLESESHKRNAEKRSQSSKQHKQYTLKTVLNCNTPAKEEKIKICQEWIRVCTAADIALNKSNNFYVREFLKSRVSNGGAIPRCSQLRDYYFFDVYQIERAEMKEKVKDKRVALMVDELSDDEGRYVLDVMVVLLDFDELSPKGKTIAYLLDSHFLSSTNKTVSQAVVHTVTDYGIAFDDVRVFSSDNVAYMKKAFCETLSCIYPHCVHITCHSHIVNLVASDFKKSFKEATEFVKCFRNLFIPSGRKSRFINFLKSSLGPGEKVTMAPNPTTKIWSAWFDSVLYHADRYLMFKDFVAEEISRSRGTASNSLIRLEEMYVDEAFLKKLHAQLSFLKVKTPTLMMYLNYFQQRMPRATQAHNKMESLLQYLGANSSLQDKDLDYCFEGDLNFTSKEKRAMLTQFNSAFTAAQDKLHKYVIEGGQPAADFLKQVRMIDPRNLTGTISEGFGSMNIIPGFGAVSRSEWELYFSVIGPLAVKESRDGELDLKLFWKSNARDLPDLYKLASR